MPRGFDVDNGPDITEQGMARERFCTQQPDLFAVGDDDDEGIAQRTSRLQQPDGLQHGGHADEVVRDAGTGTDRVVVRR